MSSRNNKRTKVFISYSHQDKAWLRKLQVHLKPLERDLDFAIWDDTKIEPGSKWKEEIKNTIDQAKVAVLLISANFLASDFIARDELPPLLTAAEEEGAIILPVILSPSRFTKTAGLSRFQAVNDPSTPLAGLSRGKQDEVFVKLTEHIENALKSGYSKRRRHIPEISIECADVANYPCDVLIMKYAQDFYGADAVVASLLMKSRADVSNISPRPGEHVLLSSNGRIAANRILFVGVLDLYQFEYGQIREFAKFSMQVLAEEMPTAKHIAMTMHGVGYGLDEREAFLSQLGGLLDALKEGIIPSSLERLVIVEKNQGRAIRLREILEEYLPFALAGEKRRGDDRISSETRLDAGIISNEKPHIFVAMPFGDDMEDVYTFGIQAPVNAAGYLCERVDMVVFTGDILTRIKSRIETAVIVVAEITGANPNVYLEVGYAWGKERPTLLLAKKGDELKFDVRSQRCIFYKNISDLAKQLEAALKVLQG